MTIAEARNEYYAATVEGEDGMLAVKLGPGEWKPSGDGWQMASFGKDFAVWEKR